MKNFICILVLSIITAFTAYTQESTETVVRKNTIKLDITSHWLYRNALDFTYERVTKPTNLIVSLLVIRNSHIQQTWAPILQ